MPPVAFVSAAAATPLLELRQLHLRRGASQVFADLSLKLDEPRIGLIGHNGAGKTSLLRLLCALELPGSGQVLSQGQDLHALPQGQLRARRVGMMFQNPDDQIIFPTVEEELALGLQPQGLARREALARARDFLAARGLADWAARAVGSLSQGQRQQVCWLALLLAGPRTLLLDEPYASLDLPGRARLADDIAGCAQQVLVSTHVLDPVRDYPRVIWLDAGKVRGDGPGREVCAAYEAAVAQEVAHARTVARAVHAGMRVAA
ncbi:energy-coupling factor ABC transporter ATP-binding protein [Alicycliphilus denitrificans]|uniref:energy-coupling factor ABC transporter ATP-binding protein n=1 Tax=Alicycliphilus denitrificans TaxID=179636 RepID=UPI00384C007B